MKMRFDVALCGQLGYELDVTKLSDDDLKNVSEQIIKYKRIREIIHNGKLYRLASPFDGRASILEYVSSDRKKAVVFHFSLKTTVQTNKSRIKLKALKNDAEYLIEGDNRIYNGGFLLNYGLELDNLKEYESRVYVFIEKE